MWVKCIRGRKEKVGVDSTLKCNLVRAVGPDEVKRPGMSDAEEHWLRKHQTLKEFLTVLSNFCPQGIIVLLLAMWANILWVEEEDFTTI